MVVNSLHIPLKQRRVYEKYPLVAAVSQIRQWDIKVWLIHSLNFTVDRHTI